MDIVNIMTDLRRQCSVFNKYAVKSCPPSKLERDMAQWLERGALPMSLPAVRFRIPLGAGFSEKYHVSPFSILGHC